MTIKKPMKTVAAEPVAAPAAVPAAGGATIADRFKLDAPAPVKKASAGVGTLAAVIAGVIALGVSGLLAFTIFQHWQFLANA